MSFKKFLAPVMSCCCVASSLVSAVKADKEENNHTLTVLVFAKDGEAKEEIKNCPPYLMFGHCNDCKKKVWANEKAICLCGDENLSFFNFFNEFKDEIIERARLKLPGGDALGVYCEKCYNKLSDEKKKQSRFIIEDTTDWKTKHKDNIKLGLCVGLPVLAYLTIMVGAGLYVKSFENSYSGDFNFYDDDVSEKF